MLLLHTNSRARLRRKSQIGCFGGSSSNGTGSLLRNTSRFLAENGLGFPESLGSRRVPLRRSCQLRLIDPSGSNGLEVVDDEAVLLVDNEVITVVVTRAAESTLGVEECLRKVPCYVSRLDSVGSKSSGRARGFFTKNSNLQ